jgi:hypothetical protein
MPRQLNSTRPPLRTLIAIAKRHCDVTLTPEDVDSPDDNFLEVTNDRLLAALEAAYKAGQRSNAAPAPRHKFSKGELTLLRYLRFHPITDRNEQLPAEIDRLFGSKAADRLEKLGLVNDENDLTYKGREVIRNMVRAGQL